MAQKDNQDLNKSNLNPEHHSTKVEPNPEKGGTHSSEHSKHHEHRERHSSKKESDKNIETPTETDDIIDKDFNPMHHSSLEDDKPTEACISFYVFSEIQREDNQPDQDVDVDDSSKPDPDSDSSQPDAIDVPEINQLIEETENFLDLCLKKVMNQEKVFASMAYRVYNMDSDLKVYKTLVGQQFNFVMNYDATFNEYYKKLSRTLPPYGDFNKAVQHTAEENSMDLPRDATLAISREIRDSTYAGWLILRYQNSIVSDVNHLIPERFSTVDRYVMKQPLTLRVIEDSLIQLNKQVDRIIELKAELHYLKLAESSQPVADYSMLVS